MTIQEAIQTALQFEGRVIAIYRAAMTQTQDPAGKKIFMVLNEEEMSHVRYLKEKLDELVATGRAVPAKIATAVPPAEKIDALKRAFQPKASSPAPESEIGLLRRALDLEVETSRFYQNMARELAPEEAALFERFAEIERGHQAIVQAEIDFITQTGFWFDIPEFRLESG